MTENGCALICGLYAAAAVILSWYALAAGEWECMYIVCVAGVLIALTAAYVLITKYLL